MAPPPLPVPLRKAIRYLRDRDLPRFQVRLVSGLGAREGVMGDCGRGAKLYTIRLDKALVYGYPEAAVYILIHEAAHLVSFDAVDGDHGLSFAVAYANLYRGWLIESA